MAEPTTRAPADSAASPVRKSPPPFTLKNVALDIFNGLHAFLYDPLASRAALPLVVCASSIICKVIIAKVKYTEIDFSTYMQQVELVNAGGLDYSLIVGDTGPIVYPAGHVQLYQFFYWLTDGGALLQPAQVVFGYVFTATVLVTCVAYVMTSTTPPWPMYLLLCSKRLYSIYVLRMFNDVFTALGMAAVVLLLQQAAYWSHVLSPGIKTLLCAVAADVFSMALSVKMNVLLFLPAFAVVVFFLVGERLAHLLLVLAVIPLVQLMIGWRFLLPLFWDDEARYLRWTYVSRAFDLSRKFLYKWTVNWRFVSEKTFSSDSFAYALLAGHVAVLAFFLLTRFVSPKVTGKSILQLIKDSVLHPFTNTTAASNLLVGRDSGPRLILLIFAVTNLIGVLFARSLHYQFLAWYCWLLPFLLYATGCNVVVAFAVFGAHEWCWNQYPSTELSSQMLVMILSLTLGLVWLNTDVWFSLEAAESRFEKEKKKNE